jgi:hypothetical protein
VIEGIRAREHNGLIELDEKPLQPWRTIENIVRHSIADWTAGADGALLADQDRNDGVAGSRAAGCAADIIAAYAAGHSVQLGFGEFAGLLAKRGRRPIIHAIAIHDVSPSGSVGNPASAVAQWGPSGEFGAEAAARRAFGKPASALSLGESAMLAATLPNPIRRNAKAPSSTLRRLAASYTARSAARGDIDRCVRPPRPA